MEATSRKYEHLIQELCAASEGKIGKFSVHAKPDSSECRYSKNQSPLSQVVLEGALLTAGADRGFERGQLHHPLSDLSSLARKRGKKIFGDQRQMENLKMEFA